jgi:hypothetical protein
VRARIHDAAGPRWTRTLVPALGAFAATAGLLWCHADGTPIGPDVFAALALFLAGPFLVGRHSPRDAELVPSAGRVAVRGAGLLRQTIHARDLVGASTTSCDGKITLALMRKGRDAPTLLELVDDRDLKTIRDALGIGHFGFGFLGFVARERAVDRARAVLRVSGALLCLLLAACIVFGVDPGPLAPAAFFFLFFALPVATVCLGIHARASADDGRLWLTPADIRVRSSRGELEIVPYSEIRAARVVDDWLVLERDRKPKVHARFHLVRHARLGLSAAETAHVLAQIEAATRRTQGESVPVPETFAARGLARQEGERARAWLERLEVTARQVSGGLSYRGAAITEDDLWAALENHDADPEVRAASARVLSAVAAPVAMARIESIFASVRDDLALKKMRVAVEPDLERASSELDELDALEPMVVRR